MSTGAVTPVLGYKPKSPAALSWVNANKQTEELLLRMLDWAQTQPDAEQRWLSIARTHLEQGFMALNRAVMQPGRIALPDDQPVERAAVEGA